MVIAAVVGLGNPEERYIDTRHNLGFRVVDLLAGRSRASAWQPRYHALVARRAGATPVLFVKPQTFMNRSGEAVAAACRGENLLAPECLVIVDDVELPLGQLRLRPSGGSGSHNGLRSVVEEIGEDFPRLRLGICGENPWQDLADYVLAPFEPAEREIVEGMVARAAECVEMALRVGIARAANRFNVPPTPDPSLS